MLDVSAPGNSYGDAAAQERKRKPFWSAVHYVYALIDPRDDRVRYIGLSLDPAFRLQDHKTTPRTPVYHWITELKLLGHSPKMAIVGSGVGFYAARDIEDQLIYEYGQFHGGLLNRTDTIAMKAYWLENERTRRWIVGMLADARENSGYWKAVCKRRRPRRGFVRRDGMGAIDPASGALRLVGESRR